jgi:flagellar basal-body rod protein FlgF
MTEPVAMITAALRADAETVRVISQNVANASTSGYRRAVPAAFAVPAVEGTATTLGAPPEIVPVTDFAAGPLTSTSATLDLAIEGPGFFVVATPVGEVVTRRGDFRVGVDGMLVTHNGDPVLGERGTIPVNGARVEVAADGVVTVDGAAVERLKVVEVAAGTTLTATEAGNYQVPSGTALLDGGASTVRQGFLEGSNVAPVNEMIRLMEAMRHFEMTQRFARGYDDMLSLAISELGRL